MFVARDKNNEIHLFIEGEPVRMELNSESNFWINPDNNNDRIKLSSDMFPEVTWKSGAKEVTLVLK